MSREFSLEEIYREALKQLARGYTENITNKRGIGLVKVMNSEIFIAKPTYYETNPQKNH